MPDGAHAALFGPNGTGKTTLLRVAAGLVEPDAGAVTRPGDIVVEAGRIVADETPGERGMG